MKKILSTVAALAVTFSAQGVTTSAINPFSGWYIGLGAAMSNSSDKVEEYYGQSYDRLEGFVLSGETPAADKILTTWGDDNAIMLGEDQVYAYWETTNDAANVKIPEGDLVHNDVVYLTSTAALNGAGNPVWVEDTGALGAAGNAATAAKMRFVSLNGYTATNAWTPELHKTHTNLGGTLSIGYMFNAKNKASIGVEVGADFVSGGSARLDNARSYFNVQNYNISAKRNPVRPMAAVVLGMPVDETLMPYIKVGASRHKSKESYGMYSIDETYDARTMTYKSVEKGVTTTGSFSKASTRPLVALGIETKVSPNMSMRYELEYRWGKKFVKDFSAADLYSIYTGKASGATKIRLNQKSTLTFRIMCMFRPSSKLFSMK